MIAQHEKERQAAEDAVEALREKYQGATSEIAGLTQRETALTQQITEAESDIQITKLFIKNQVKKCNLW